MSKRRQPTKNDQAIQQPVEVAEPTQKSGSGVKLIRTARKTGRLFPQGFEFASGTPMKRIQQQSTEKKAIFEFQNSQFPQQTSQKINPRQPEPLSHNKVPEFPEQPTGFIGTNLPLNYFKPRLFYQLDTFNSIAICKDMPNEEQGQIYNLLDQPSVTEKIKRGSKCNCTQSKCKARYCICYSKNQKCSEECGCIGCQNVVILKGNIGEEDFKGCRCERSGCMKNYCECHKDGLFCTEVCRCTNCHNISQSHPLYFVNQPNANKKRRIL